MTDHAVSLPAVPSIDLEYRPASYFWPLGLETHLLSRIKGAERKAVLQRLIDAGRLDEVPAFLTESALTADDRRAIGRLHPAFMGGEYLPDIAQNEVIIARIVIASTTQDVTCVYARRGKSRIHYRVVDEYDGDTLDDKRMRTSTRPLTLGQLEAFLNGAWSIFDVLEMNFADDGYPLEQMLRFVVAVESEFYPELGALYEERIRSWAAEHQPEADTDEEEAQAAPSGDISDLKSAVKLQDGIDETIRRTDHERDGETTGPSNKPANSIPRHTATAEDYKKMSGWQIGTFHRASPPTAPAAPTSSAAPTGDMSDIKTAAKLQDRIDEVIRKMDKKDGYTS
jgi:hypothetical protein